MTSCGWRRGRALGLLFSLLSFVPTNITARDIQADDADPTFFTFMGEWNTIAPDHPCNTCEAVPGDLDRVFMRTFRDGNAGRGSGTVKFRGSAISLFGIGVNLHGQGDLEYRINNGPVSRSSIRDDRTLNFRYNELLARAENLDPGQEHILAFNPALEPTHRGGLIFVDYAVITVPDETTTTSSSRTTPITSRATSRVPTTSESTTSTEQETHSRGASSTSSASSSSTDLDASSTNLREPENTSGQADPTTSGSSNSNPPSGADSIASTVPSNRGPNVGAIAGGVVGALVLIALTLFLLFCRRSRQRVRPNAPIEADIAAPQAFSSYSAVPQTASDLGSATAYPPSDRLTAHYSDASLRGSALQLSPSSSFASLSASPLQHSSQAPSPYLISPFQQTFPTNSASPSAPPRGQSKAPIIAPAAPVQVFADEALLNRVRELEDQLAEANSRPARRDTTRTMRSEQPPPYS